MNDLDVKKTLEEAKKCYATLGKLNPEAMKGFADFFHASEKEGALSAKFKQIILLSISIIEQCNWCIVYHTHKALSLGATKEELVEACFITSVMGGGSALMYNQIVLKAIEEFQS